MCGVSIQEGNLWPACSMFVYGSNREDWKKIERRALGRREDEDEEEEEEEGEEGEPRSHNTQ